MSHLRRLRFSLLLLLLALMLALAGCHADETATPALPSAGNDAAKYGATEPGGAGMGEDQWLLVMPDDGPNAVIDHIRSAKKSIRFKIYLLTYREARNELIKAANRGVDVKVLIDKEPVGGGESNAESYQMLKEGGVDVKWAPGAFKNVHEKSLVIDDRLALIATFNFTHGSFSRNREYALVTTRANVVADVAAIFDADWAGEGVRVSADSPLVVSPENSRERITGLIQGAQKSLWLEEATLLDEDITRALEQAARRGVEVRFISPNRDDNDVAAENLARLAAAGGQTVRLDDPYVHAKVILADGKQAFVGSENLTFTSLELNRELGIITEDEAVIERLAFTLAQDWARAGGEQTSPKPPAGVISWRDAEKYAGQEVTVAGTIVHTYDSGKVTFLNFDDDYRNTLTIVLFPDSYDAFPQKPARYFKDKQVQVTGKVKMYEGAPEIVIDDPAQIQVVGGYPTSAAPAPAARSDSAPPAPWQDAGEHVGETITVAGAVARTYNSGKAAFLNFDEDWRGKFSVVIFASDFDKFPRPPDELYLHKNILVTGKIKEYKGAPEMIVESPEQIEIVGDAQANAAPTTVAASPPKGVVPWQNAGDYAGQTITVSGRIIHTKNIGSITFLDFGKDEDDFVAVVRAEDYANFPAPPAELYDGKKVWITGEISTHKGAPQMALHSPQQIQVFD